MRFVSVNVWTSSASSQFNSIATQMSREWDWRSLIIGLIINIDHCTDVVEVGSPSGFCGALFVRKGIGFFAHLVWEVDNRWYLEHIDCSMAFYSMSIPRFTFTDIVIMFSLAIMPHDDLFSLVHIFTSDRSVYHSIRSTPLNSIVMRAAMGFATSEIQRSLSM